jgi:hypothetical protein
MIWVSIRALTADDITYVICRVSVKRPCKGKILSVESPIYTMLCKASPKSNLLCVPRGIVDSHSTLPWVMWEAVTAVEGIP